MLKLVGATSVCVALLMSTGGHAAPAPAPVRRPLEVQSLFGADDAVKGQAYVKVAMTAPMLDLVNQATVTNPQAMLEYGLALELGRPSASSSLKKGERDKLKRGFNAMVNAYLTPQDKFAGVTFHEDSMLDVPDFWITLAEHIGRPKEHIDRDIVIAGAQAEIPMGMAPTASAPTYIPDDQQSDEFNLSSDLVLDREVVNAAWTCAQSARSFARLKKVQLLDISETKLTPAQFASALPTVIDFYRASYNEGVLSCGTSDFFFQVADVASANLGKLGELKEDANARLAPLEDKTNQQ